MNVSVEMIWIDLDWTWLGLIWMKIGELGFVFLGGKICDIFGKERIETENDKEKWVMGG